MYLPEVPTANEPQLPVVVAHIRNWLLIPSSLSHQPLPQQRLLGSSPTYTT